MEKILCETIVSFLAHYNILSSSQHEFPVGRYTQTAILQFIDQLSDKLHDDQYFICKAAYLGSMKTYICCSG